MRLVPKKMAFNFFYLFISFLFYFYFLIISIVPHYNNIYKYNKNRGNNGEA